MSQGLGKDDTFTVINFDFDKLPHLSNPWRQLNLHAVAIGLIRLPPNSGYTFTHTHVQQEEVYIVVEGEGQILLNDELIAIKRGDLIRVAPTTKRALKASPKTALFVICAGGVAEGYPKNPNARYLIDDGVPDYDDVPPWYEGNPEIVTKNLKLKDRMLKSQNAQQDKSDISEDF